MKKFYPCLGAAILGLFFSMAEVQGQYPGSGQVPLDPTAIPQFVEPVPHFAGLRIDAKAGGKLIIEAVKTQQVAVSAGTVLDNGTVGVDAGAGLGNYFAYRISKDGGITWYGPLWPAFTIEAQKGNALKVEVRNKLNGLTYKDVNIPADQTVMMDGVPLTGDKFSDPYEGPVPIAVHLHGGEVPSASDGGPDSWFTPDYELKGKGWNNGVGPVLNYPNLQEAATLWYHEHSQLGLTRINVYAGMAGFYFLRGADEQLGKLPGYNFDDLVKEVTPPGKVADALHPGAYLPEIELAIQDRMFDKNGQLYYPVDEIPNPEIHPLWSPEFFGDVITVNGKSWPYLSVAPRKYRFHILDGSNARFYSVWLQDLASGAYGPAIVQIGTDGGLMDAPVTIDPVKGQKLLMGPGERFDVIIDFSKVAPGTVLTLMNDANAPHPSGEDVEAGTTDRIMQFIVNGEMVSRNSPNLKGIDKSNIPSKLRIVPMVKLTDFAGIPKVKPDVIRQLTLNEVSTDEGPVMALLNNSRYEDMPEMGMFGAVTEKPLEGTTEVWQLINLTMDAHPMHMHLVQFQLVSRQDFDMDRYMDDYMKSFSGIYGGMPGMFMGAEGPPFPYDIKNSDGAVGGNLPVSSYLLGNPIPPDPNERGWKDVIKSYPNQVTTYIVRFAPQELPLGTPKLVSRYSFDPSKGPGYVWHCHLVEHEDNDMMRPLVMLPNPSRGIVSSYKNLFDNNPAAGFDLKQNAPNPFNTSTAIFFVVPTDIQVTIKLYNVLGIEVKTIVNATYSAGTQSVVLSAAGLRKGLYYYQMKAGPFSATKALIIN